MFRAILTTGAALMVMACAPEADTQAQERAEGFGLAAGQSFPDMSVTDASGEERRLSDLTGENGLVLYFNRSIDWCPYCQTQVIDVNGAADAFAERGFEVAVITYDPAEYADWRDITINLLSDPDSALIDAFDVRDPLYTDPGHFAYGVPYPITYVIGADGVIIAKLWHEAGYGADGGYRERITTDDILEVIDRSAG
ncbi:MAG: hypothetical protein CMF74_17390 [Maricaulis sp.]|jgi:peroxiredoxin|nr:hypothetical protein [Maricaulis sp.]MAL11421.1 hypothetical protein [Maricaulis sp.]HAQ34888.1 hypothetical protein [Alphaproteobacteria bacterium]|tara:strand:- start:412 stop:1002 length:591 start_codon:yes stop_codon:yes gene_type:complete